MLSASVDALNYINFMNQPPICVPVSTLSPTLPLPPTHGTFARKKSTVQRTNWCEGGQFALEEEEEQLMSEIGEREKRRNMTEIRDRFEIIATAPMPYFAVRALSSYIFSISSSFAVSMSTDDLHVLFPSPPIKREGEPGVKLEFSGKKFPVRPLKPDLHILPI